MESAEEEPLSLFRQEMYMVVVYSVFYGVVFFCGFLGNIFVILAVALHAQLRSTTDYLISSLAMADLLIMIICLPTTLLNNILIEWYLGQIFCKMSTWMNSTTSCASIYTLVAVTLDRYFAICHTMKYTLWEAGYTLYVIAGIWLVSASLAVPTLYSMDEVQINYNNHNMTLCVAQSDTKLQFIFVNLILAFIVPFLLISISYTKIFVTVSNHRSLAVDAHIRDERVKLRVATMMLTVIVIFALCWLPLYCIYIYFYFSEDKDSEFFRVASQMLRPFFQWLSLLSSSLNPLIYIAYSQKYRRAFHRILLRPCKSRYEVVRDTIMRTSDTPSTTIRSYKKQSTNRTFNVTPMPSSLIDGSPMITVIDSPKSDKRDSATVC